MSGEPSSSRSPDDRAAATEPTLGGDDNTSTGSVCSPNLGGLVPAEISPLKVKCPSGYEARDASKTLPVAGRFSSNDELIKAYCVKLLAVPPKLSLNGSEAIDFSTHDVVAFAYDAKAGAPTLYRRGEELWLQTKSDTCAGSAPSLASVAFVIPKHVDVNEQSCTLRCE